MAVAGRRAAPDPHAGRPSRSRLSRFDRARRAAWLLGRLRRVVPVDSDVVRLWVSLALVVAGVALLASAAVADRHFHRGMMTGAELPYVFHPTGPGLATNLDAEVLNATPVETVATALQTNGFRYVRVTFLWSQIEPARDQFEWERVDRIFDEFTSREIEVIAVLRGTPIWARPDGADPALDGPPADLAAFARFVGQFVDRYNQKKQIDFVQIWDLPNTPERWGGVPATPPEYAEILAAAHTAIHAVRPEIATVLAEFESRPGGDALDDLAFLRGIYAAGAAPFFEIVAATADGGLHSPFDRDVDPDRHNLSRLILVREIIEEAGDGATPLWATRYGWPNGDAGQGIDPELRADFTVEGIERAREEWPWLGLLFNWELFQVPGRPSAPYALLTSDGLATPTFSALAAYAAHPKSTVAGVGYVPTGARSLAFGGRWEQQNLPLRSFQTTNEVGATVSVRFRGTGLIAFLRQSPNAGTIDASLDGAPLTQWSGSSLAYFQARDVPLLLVTELDDGMHVLELTLTGEGELTVGGFIVIRDLPFLWPVASLGLAGAAALVLALWQTTRVVAMRSGVLRRRQSEDIWLAVPELPHVPSTRRF